MKQVVQYVVLKELEHLRKMILIFSVRPDQIESEVKGVIDLILDVYKDFGFKDFKFRLSLKRHKER